MPQQLRLMIVFQSVYEIGEFLTVTSDISTSRRGPRIYIWSKEGRKIKTRAVE